MWQRFTERARKAVFYAQEEAQKFGAGYVSTEHLLLGICREADNVAGRVLNQIGASSARIINETTKHLPRNRGEHRSQDMTLTPRAKRAIDLAFQEAQTLGNNYIGTEHLLLGLVRESDGLAGRVLAKCGVSLEAVRREVLRMQSPSTAEATSADVSLTKVPEHQQVMRTARQGHVSGLLGSLLLMRQSRCTLDALAIAIISEGDVQTNWFIARLNLALTHREIMASIEQSMIEQLYTEAETTSNPITEIIAFGLEEAGGRTLSTPHLLTGIFRHGKNCLAKFLASKGVTIELMRSALAEMQS